MGVRLVAERPGHHPRDAEIRRSRRRHGSAGTERRRPPHADAQHHPSRGRLEVGGELSINHRGHRGTLRTKERTQRLVFPSEFFLFVFSSWYFLCVLLCCGPLSSFLITFTRRSSVAAAEQAAHSSCGPRRRPATYGVRS